MGSLGEATLDLRVNSSRFNRGIDSARGRVDKLGRGFAQVGRALAGFGTVVTGVAALTIKMATDFNKSMANVATLIPGNIDRVNELKGSVQELAIAHGKDTADLAQGLYQTISAFGDKAGQTVKILEINSKAAAAGLAETTQAVDLTSAITKAYGDTTAEAVEKVADLALMTVRLGQTDFPALAASMGKVTPIAQAMGQTQEDLFAVFATATGVVGKASEVSTQYRGILAALLNPTADLTKLIEEQGFASGKAMLEQQGLVGTLQSIVAAAEASGEPITKYISQIEAVPLALALAGPQADTFTAKLAELGNAAGAVDAAFREQTEGINKLGFQWAQLQQQAVVLAQNIGDTLIPVASELLSIFQELISGAGGTESLVASLRGNLGPAINLISEVVIILTRAWTGWEIVIRTITGLLGTFVGGVLGGLFTALEKVTGAILAMSDILVGLGKLTPENANKIRDMQVSLQGLATDGFDFASGSMALMKEEIIGQLDAQSDLERRIKSVTERLVGAAAATEKLTKANVIAAPAARNFADSLGSINEQLLTGIPAATDFSGLVGNLPGLFNQAGAASGSGFLSGLAGILGGGGGGGGISGLLGGLFGGAGGGSGGIGGLLSGLLGGGGGGGGGGFLSGLLGGGGGGGGGLGGFLSGLLGGGGAGSGLTGGLSGLIGGGIESLINTLLGTTLSTVLGPLGPLVSTALTQIGGLIVGGIKSLFSGPSAEELAARGVVDAFKNNALILLDDMQKIEAGGERWKATNILVRDSYLALGMSEAEALAAVEKLNKASKETGPAAEAAVAAITSVVEEAAAAAKAAGQTLTDFRNDAINAANGAVEAVAETVTKTTEEVANAARRAADTVSDTLGNIDIEIPVRFDTSGLAGLDLDRGDASLSVPRLARGGIVNQPTLALIGEAGPEAVVPLGRGGSGSMTVNLDVSGERMATTVIKLTPEILRQLGLD